MQSPGCAAPSAVASSALLVTGTGRLHAGRAASMDGGGGRGEEGASGASDPPASWVRVPDATASSGPASATGPAASLSPGGTLVPGAVPRGTEPHEATRVTRKAARQNFGMTRGRHSSNEPDDEIRADWPIPTE